MSAPAARFGLDVCLGVFVASVAFAPLTWIQPFSETFSFGQAAMALAAAGPRRAHADDKIRERVDWGLARGKGLGFKGSPPGRSPCRRPSIETPRAPRACSGP